MHLSEGHRSDMLLDLSGLTREERVMVQASINNEGDFDKVADALINQHPRIHLRESVASPYYEDFTFAEDYGHNDSKVETADAYRARNDAVNPGSEVGEEVPNCEDDKKYDMFLHL